MNSNLQFDSHPDAESLNAFAEQALPEREHGQVLAHLAACSRCRQVVFLAQETASELEMQEAGASRPELDRAAPYEFAAAMAAASEPLAAVVAASGRGAEKRRGWWLGGWRLAWVPAAALAAIIGGVIFVHSRQARLGETSGNESLVVVPQSPSQPIPKPSASMPADQTAMEKAQPAAPSIAAKAPVGKAPTASASAPSKAFSAQAAPPPQAPRATGAKEVSIAEARPLPPPQERGAVTQLNAPVLRQAAPTAEAPRPEPLAGVNSLIDASPGTASATAHGAAGHVSASAMAPQSALKAASMGSFVSSQPMPVSNTAVLAARKARITPLPSGLRAVSTVTAKHRTLAIDSSGALFLSEDSGIKWEPVARQWSGRAVAVRMQAGMTINGPVAADTLGAGAEAEPNRSNPDSAVVPPAVFEIVNDSGLVWVSADGKTWKAK